MIEQILYLVIGIGAGIILVMILNRRKADSGSTQEHVMAFQRLMTEQMDRMVAQMDRSKDFLANRVSAAERSVRSVSSGLGKLEQATSMLQQTSNEIASFQNMLKSPKVRGSFGEVLLGNLLGDVLPGDRYEMQFTFRSGEIADAIIRLQDGYIVAIDSKFPLANYEMYVSEQDTDRKAQLRKIFISDLKQHVTAISKKYIVPQEQTLGYAFMYIPTEGVYYETMIHTEEGSNTWEYCLAHKVVPVSPNSFLAYLQTVLVGLRGMRVEQQAREILEHIGQLRRDFGTFADDFTTVGTHLTNAKNRYDDSARRLDKFTNRLEQLEAGDDKTAVPN